MAVRGSTTTRPRPHFCAQRLLFTFQTFSDTCMGGGKVCSHGSGLEPFLLGALHAKIPGKELSKGGEGGGTNRQFREGRNKGEEKGDQKNGRARDLLIKQHREVPESWPRRRREGGE